MSRKSVEIGAGIAGAALAVGLVPLLRDNPHPEKCSITVPSTTDSPEAAMRGYAASIDQCYGYMSAGSRNLSHESSAFIIRIAFPTQNGSRIEMEAESTKHRGDGKPDPEAVSRISAAVYGKKGAWMPKYIITARRPDGAAGPNVQWDMDMQSHTDGTPSVAVTGDQLLVNSQPHEHTANSLDMARSALRDCLDTTMATPQHDPSPEPGYVPLG